MLWVLLRHVIHVIVMAWATGCDETIETPITIMSTMKLSFSSVLLASCLAIASASAFVDPSRADCGMAKSLTQLSAMFAAIPHSSRVRRGSPLLLSSADTVTSSPRKLSLYNSLSRTKEPFRAISSPKVTMYTCGPTVYDYAHVGNFRAFLTYDVLKRALLYLGYDVDHICNLTDVDDKIIARCDRENVGLIELTRKFEGLFLDDLDALNIIRAREYPRATDHIPEMVQLIKDLEERGLAYQSEEGSWYFNVGEKEGYGQQLVQLDTKNMQSGASGAGSARGTDADEYDADKVGVRDFALWKAYKPDFDRDDATWDTDIGRGRPGWHLECSAMAKRYLGETIDIHCGGIDLKFPHHENEIAQSEGANDKPFCKCWLHNGFVNIGDEKMSKSKGNFLTLRGACPKADDVRAYRYLVVSSQYRNPLSFTEAAMGAAKGALKRMDRIREQIDEALKEGADDILVSGDDGDIADIVEKELANFEAALVDDLSMPRAAASLFGVVKAAENEFKRIKKAEKDGGKADPPLDLAGLRAVKKAMDEMDRVFGVFYTVPKAKKQDGSVDESADDDDDDAPIPEAVMALVAERTAAKEAKEWDRADSLRAEITELGYSVKDVKGEEPLVCRVG